MEFNEQTKVHLGGTNSAITSIAEINILNFSGDNGFGGNLSLSVESVIAFGNHFSHFDRLFVVL